MLIFSLFITSNYIINSFYTNQFLFLIEGSIIIFALGFIALQKSDITISKITFYNIIIVALWISYILFTDYFINTNGEKTKSTYLIVSLILYIALTFIFTQYQNIKKITFVFISILAGIESIYCILQFLEIIKTNNSSIKVTGSWVNPNITAMFLALILPFVLLSVLDKLTKYRKVFVTLLTLIIVSLILLKCRTAILGSLLAVGLVLEWHYKVYGNFINRSSRKLIFATTVLVILLITIVGYFSYYVKKDSADGRKLIWSLSLKMIAEKPLFGFGYGSFERNYNLEQANYFSGDISTENEKVNASHTDMAYNEIIENAVEGGIFGYALFVAFIALTLHNGRKLLTLNSYKTNSNTISTKPEMKNIDSEIQVIVSCIIGIIVLLFMSLVNFTITAVPIMCIFLLFASIISASKLNESEPVIMSSFIKKFFTLTFILMGLLLFYNNLTTAFYQRKITTAINYAKDKEYANAFSVLETIPIRYQKNVNFYQSLSNLYYLNNQKDKALEVYEKSNLLYSSPLLYQQIGDCYFAQKGYSNAIQNYEMAKNIQPNRFTPRYLLLKVYIEQKDKINALKYANEIVLLDEKVPSSTTNSIKKIAQQFLKSVNKKNG